MKIKELCSDERPREKMLEKGAFSLSNAELLAILIRTGTGRMNAVDVARELLKMGDGKLTTIAGMSAERLCEVKGIGKDKAATIVSAFELGRRSSKEKIIESRISISSPRTVCRLMLPHLRDLDHEECWIIYLNRANYMIAKEKISSGGLDSTVMDTKVILRKALEKKASGIIMIHNHPSGNPIPGTADIQATELLDKALKTCGISLLDHVITADDSYYSFADEEVRRDI